jgi:uncharacterized phage-associated protein
MGSKSLAVAQCIVDKSEVPITPMKLLKLVYIAHGYMLGMDGTPLLDEQVQAWKFGPVVASVYKAVRDYRSSPVKRVAGAGEWAGRISIRELTIISIVLEKYGQVDAVALSGATHKPGTPWATTWSFHEQNAEISNDLITYFYRNMLRQTVHSAL